MQAMVSLRGLLVRLTKPKLVKAAKRGDLNEVQRLLETGHEVNVCDHYGRTALMEASRQGHIDMVRLLLRKGADACQESLSGRSALRYARHRNVLQALLEHQRNVHDRCPMK
jgi:uncharacterized protein